MTKIEFTISNPGDAELGARIMAAIAAEYGAQVELAPWQSGEPIRSEQAATQLDTLQPVQLGAAPSVRRPRRAKVDPVAAYTAAGGSMPVQGVSAEDTATEQTGSVEPPAPVAETPAPDEHSPAALVEQPAPAAPDSPKQTRDEMLVAVRLMARERGILWMRGIIEAAKAEMLSGLSDEQLAAALAS